MAKKQAQIPPHLQPWIEARRKFHLSHAHVQMARELGMNPKKLGKLDNHDQEPWKLPLREFIGKLYFKRFGKERPDAVRSIEEMAAALCPFFHRSHSSAFCAAVNQIRDVTMAHLLTS